ncbi:MAG: DUF1848 domain-containing protein [Mailhella sp.]|nr:DUF1848 domain-containing protein [Mailhella sp.]
MLVSASGRTDIPHYYGEWLMRRLKEGWVLSRNPLFPEKVSRLRLDPDLVDALIFCSKDPSPMLGNIERILGMGFRIFFFVTITSYGSDIEPGVPPWREAAGTFARLSALLGKERICWRYDPVLLTPKYTVEHHALAFEEMCSVLEPYASSCVFSFVQMYRKLAYAFPSLRPVPEADKLIMLRSFSYSAARHGIQLRTCAETGDYASLGIARSGCVTVPLLEKAFGIRMRRVQPRPMREGCQCLPMHDIGAYDACPSGCRYCYATSSKTATLRNYAEHNPDSPMLNDSLRKGDIVTEAVQRSFFLPRDGQLSLL